MKDTKISNTISLYIGLLVVGYLMVSLIVWRSAQQTDHQLALIAGQYLPASQLSTEAEIAFAGVLRLYEAAVLTGEPALLDTATEEADNVRQYLVALRELDEISDGLKDQAQTILSALPSFTQTSTNIYVRLITEESDDELVAAARDLAAAQVTLRKQIADLSYAIAHEVQAEIAEAVSRSDRRLNMWVLFFFGLVLILAGISIFRQYRVASREVEERRRAEISLQASEQQLRILFDQSPDAIIVENEQGVVLAANEAACRLHNMSREDLIGQHVSALIAGEEALVVGDYLRKWFAGENAYHIGYSKGKAGAPVPVEIHANRIQYEGKAALLLHVRDITQRLATEDALAHEKERLAVTLRSIGDAVIATGRDDHIVLMNPAAEVLTGWSESEATGRSISDVFSLMSVASRDLPLDPVKKVLANGAVVDHSDVVLTTRSGNEYIVAYSAAPIRDATGRLVGVVLAIKDETQKHKLEEEQLKSAKLDSLGVLAGGIAHDFNNLLTAILGNISMARMTGGKQPEDLEDLLTEAEQAAVRARNLTQQLLTFAKGGAPVTRVMPLQKLITEAAELVLRGSASKLEINIPDDLWPAEVDPGQIGQVIHNIVLNADQAMPNGGHIRVAARNQVLTEDESVPLSAGNYVTVLVQDTGVGIPPESLAKIFDPYFTTKRQGSGLGLATSFSIIKQHGGHIHVETREGKGTLFAIYLPASEARPTETTDASVAADHAGTGRILIMDDEKVICTLLSKLLQRSGYRMAAAADGQQAVALYKQAMEEDDRFDAVILDLTIPGGMGGRDAVRALLDLDPHVKAIVSSGYSNDPAMSDAQAFGFCGVVRKPYKREELLRVVESVLNTTQQT